MGKRNKTNTRPWLAALALSFTFACTQKKSDAHENKPNDDTRRPTEAGEGVPGYLTDPSAVVVKVEDGTVIISAPAGSVVAEAGSVTDVNVAVIQIETRVLEQAIAEGGAQGSLVGKIVASGKASADGSFRLTFPFTSFDPVVIHVGGGGDDGTVSFERPNEKVSTVYKPLGLEVPAKPLVPEPLCTEEASAGCGSLAFSIKDEVSGQPIPSTVVLYRTAPKCGVAALATLPCASGGYSGSFACQDGSTAATGPGNCRSTKELADEAAAGCFQRCTRPYARTSDAAADGTLSALGLLYGVVSAPQYFDARFEATVPQGETVTTKITLVPASSDVAP